jgi:hypothetical protein
MALPGFRVAQTMHGGHPFITEKAPAASETFIAGAVVRLIVDDTIKTAADDDATAYGVALDSAVDASGTLRAACRVAVFDGNNLFSADNSGTTLAMGTHSGDDASLNVTGTAHSVVVGTAGNALFKVAGADSTDDASESGSGDRVIVNVDTAASQVPGYGTAAPDAT